jgi:SlyX protein
MEHEDRMISLETKISYLENFVAELNKVIIEQEKIIKMLTAETRAIKKQIEEKKEKLPEMEKPPHY